MARIVGFQIPERQREQARVITTITRGKVIEFPTLFEKRKGADRVREQSDKRSDCGMGEGLPLSQAARIL